MKLLRQSTAISVIVGPFLDETDGKTPETALNAAATDLDFYKGVTKSDITDTDSAGSNDFAHVANGYYSLELTTGNTDTLGDFLITVNATGALPVWDKFMVVPAAVYDALVNGSGNGIRGDVQALANNVITASAIATDAIDADAIKADAVTEIQSGLSTLTQANVRSAVGLASANLDTQLDALPTAAENAAALLGTDVTGDVFPETFQGYLQDIAGNSANAATDTTTLLSRVGTPSNLGSGATLAANAVDIEAQTDDIGAAGAGLTNIPWNASWDAEVQSEVQDAIEANHLDHLLAADYDPASKPGVSTALLNELVESDGGVSRFTANALEQAPGGSGAIYGESGSITFTYTVYKPGGSVPLSGAAVWVSSDSAGTNRSQTKISDALGRVQFDLNAGTVYFWRRHANYAFTDPDTEVVS